LPKNRQRCKKKQKRSQKGKKNEETASGREALLLKKLAWENGPKAVKKTVSQNIQGALANAQNREFSVHFFSVRTEYNSLVRKEKKKLFYEINFFRN